MEIWQITGLCICATVLGIVLKSHRPEFTLQISAAAGVCVFVILLPKISELFAAAEQFAAKSSIDFAFLEPIVKITAIAYIAQFGTEICKDAGESAIASKVEMAGKILIAYMALPIITGLFDTVAKIIG